MCVEVIVHLAARMADLPKYLEHSLLTRKNLKKKPDDSEIAMRQRDDADCAHTKSALVYFDSLFLHACLCFRLQHSPLANFNRCASQPQRSIHALLDRCAASRAGSPILLFTNEEDMFDLRRKK
jgi:hypothetical protein